MAKSFMKVVARNIYLLKNDSISDGKMLRK